MDLKKNTSLINVEIQQQQEIQDLIKQSEEILATQFTKAVECAEQAKELAQKHFFTKELADSLKQLSLCYAYISDYGKVMRTALEAMDLYISCNNYGGEAECLNILGGVYNFLQDYNKRLECNLKCLVLRKKANDEKGQITTYNNIGDTYTVMQDYENALKYFNICLTFDLTNRMKAIVYYNIGEVNYFKKEYKIAQEFIQKGLAFGIETDYWQIIIAAYQMQANILLLDKKYNEAIEILTKAFEISKLKKSKEDQYPLFELFSKAYSGLKDYKNAYQYLNKYNNLKNELHSLNNAQKLKKIEFEHQLRSLTSETDEIKKKNTQIVAAFKKIEIQRNEIESKNIAITDSIHYAKRIQFAILPSDKKVKTHLKNCFVFYQPKDIVSGDFYWVEQVNDEIIFSVIDCTGHGVPGAFVSLIAYNMINKVVLENQITKPAEILNKMDELMQSLFKNSEENIRDGVDMGICSYNIKTNELNFAGAFHSLFVCEGNELNEIKGNRESIGFSIYEKKKDFVNHKITLKKGTTLYLCTDGLPDQFGGIKGKKLKWKGVKEKLMEWHKQPISQQKNAVKTFFNVWKNDLEQLDDVCIIGVRI
ncbi:MAG: SpoIIE family protein phosphatase [Bacteroidetes bacterium]|nr:SpoIIE family protein phosphatase [Bacteroidota bacterium]